MDPLKVSPSHGGTSAGSSPCLTASLLAGTGNSFETMDVRFENISNPWSPGARVVQPWLHRQPRHSERQAAFPFGTALPRYLLFYNPRRRNRWGHARSYRIQHSSHAGPVLPRGWQEEEGVSWGRWGRRNQDVAMDRPTVCPAVGVTVWAPSPVPLAPCSAA